MASETPVGKWNFDNSYTELPDVLYKHQLPTSVPDPRVISYNESLAEELGLSFLTEDIIKAQLSGNQLPNGAKSIAQAYAGHQFGHFTMLGDGRAILLGEQITPSGDRFDIQLKGSGKTYYSRRGDGRATLSAMLREYLISEAMHHLGVPSTRSLAVVSTGRTVYREEEHDGGVLTRIAASHIRVGTFEYVRNFCSPDVLKEFTNYVIHRHYPEIQHAENPALEFLRAVMKKQVDLIVNWMRVGFIHGVMNTDNMSIAGETIDYGPCAFMNAYHPETVFSSIDAKGRYAYINQPPIAHWNLGALASALLPVIGSNEEATVPIVQAVLNEFPELFKKQYQTMMLRKLGILYPSAEDGQLVNDLLVLLEKYKTDYTNFFLVLESGVASEELIFSQEDFVAWKTKWEECISRNDSKAAGLQMMRTQNPMFIPRNHLVEHSLDLAQSGGLSAFHDLVEQIRTPYRKDGSEMKLQEVPMAFDQKYQTFCGT